MAGRRARSARPPLPRTSQHFLRSRVVAAEIVRHADVCGTDLVVEIGAGHGVLTRELARRAGRVEAIELDAALATALRRRFASHENVRIVEGNALTLPLPAQDFTVVANLPFHATTDTLRRLLDDPSCRLRRADVIVAWEAAQKRARLWPSTLLGVSWGAWYALGVARRLPAACFAPRPSVDAAVLVVERRRRPLIPTDEWQRFRVFARAGFGRPRLADGLAPFVSRRAFRRAADVYGFGRDASGRELDVYQWVGLYRETAAPSVRPVTLPTDHEPL